MPVFTLPPATAGRHFGFFEGFAGRAGQTTTIVPQPGEIIIVASTTVSQIESSDVPPNVEGSAFMELVCIIDGTWKAMAITGPWILIP